MGRYRTFYISIIIIVSLFFAGCSSVATKKKFYEPVTLDLKAQKYAEAVARIEAARADNKYAQKDRLIYYMDAGLAYHYDSQYDPSNEKLHSAEQAAEELFTNSISRSAASLLLNDNILEYSGEEYEILYANLIKALNYLALNNFDDAFVEIRRSNEKLDLLEQKYADMAQRYSRSPKDDTANVNARINYEVEKVRFNNDAFARYLSMHMYAAEGKFDDARIDHDLFIGAFESQPHIYNFPMPEVKYLPEADDKALVSVVALAGLAPTKEAINLRLRSDKQLNLIQVLYTDGERKDTEYGHILFPVKEDIYFKFSVPKIARRYSAISRIRLSAGNRRIGELQLVEDITNIAEETFKARKSLIYFRTLARSIVKAIAAYKLKQKVDKETGGGLGGWLGKVAVDIGADVIENADLRCSQILPGRIYIGDFELDPGTYDFTIEFLSSDGSVVGSRRVTGYRVNKNKLNMVEVFSLN